MEIAVPVITGVLTALCLYGVTACAGNDGKSVRLAPSKEQVGQAVQRACAVAGAFLPARVRRGERTRRAAAVLRHVAWHGKRPFRDYATEELLGALALMSAAGALAGAVVSFSLLGAMVGFVAPIAFAGLSASRRGHAEEKRVESAMPEAFTALSMSLGSGHSLAQGMRFVGSHADEPIKTEFLQVSYAVTCGIPATEALDDMLGRVHAPGLDLVALALKVSQRTGAPLKDLLSEAASMVGERMELRRRLDVKTSQARMSARMVAAMPMAMIALLSLLSSDFRAGLTTVTGAVSIAVALTLNAAAWAIIRRIMRVDLS